MKKSEVSREDFLAIPSDLDEILREFEASLKEEFNEILNENSFDYKKALDMVLQSLAKEVDWMILTNSGGELWKI